MCFLVIMFLRFFCVFAQKSVKTESLFYMTDVCGILLPPTSVCTCFCLCVCVWVWVWVRNPCAPLAPPTLPEPQSVVAQGHSCTEEISLSRSENSDLFFPFSQNTAFNSIINYSHYLSQNPSSVCTPVLPLRRGRQIVKEDPS